MKQQIWQHETSGDRFAVIVESDTVTDVWGPLTSEQVQHVINTGRQGIVDWEGDISEERTTQGDDAAQELLALWYERETEYRVTWTSSEIE